MRSMTFQIDDQSTGNAVPAVIVTLTENSDGSVSFTLTVVGDYTGDLRGFFFDLADESHLGTLSISDASAGFTELQVRDDSISNLGDGANMQGLLGSDGGFDAGIEIGTAGIGSDDYQSFSFTLASTDPLVKLSLEDFSNVDFGVRLTSVGDADGARIESAKLLEHTSVAIDTLDDGNSVDEDATNPVSGNVLREDLNLGTEPRVIVVEGQAVGDTGAAIVGKYGTLHIHADGSYTYTLDNDNDRVQALAVGESLSDETFSYTASTSHEATSFSSDTATLTITIVGANDAPRIVAAVDAGSVAEFPEDSAVETVGSHSASGTVDFEDVDLSDVHSVSVMPVPATYLGTLTAQISDDATGDGEGQVGWTFTVSDAALEHLGEGDSLTQTYTLAVDDDNGGVATQNVTITIDGSNDAPEIVPGVTEGDVFEDGSRRASGRLSATDIDLGHSLTWSVDNPSVQTNPSYRFLIDNFSVTRNGLPYFNDGFGDNAPPPAAPPLQNELPPNTPQYTMNGTMIEFGGRAILDGSRSVLVEGVGNPNPRYATSARLLTDNTTDPTRGLKIDDSFVVEGRFDLVLEMDPGDNYGIRLSDSGGGVTGSDVVQLAVRRNATTGQLQVALVEIDGPTDSTITRQAIALDPRPGENQIVLRLSHDPANPGVVTASFELQGGTAPRPFAFTQVARIFGTGTADPSDNEDWTRAEFRAVADGALQNGQYGTLSIKANGEWSYQLNSTAANVQALYQGEHVTDTFTVRVTDEHGASDTQTVTIDVFGTNDNPIITTAPPQLPFILTEDSPINSASQQLSALDVDGGARLTWSIAPLGIAPGPVPPGSPAFAGYTASYLYTLDDLAITRNGLAFFTDPFADGVAPPSAPNFTGTTIQANYLTTGLFTESGNRLVLDGSKAGAISGIGTEALVVGNFAVLNTNIDPADLTRGLKSDDDFTIAARFDFGIVDENREGFGIALTDRSINGLVPDQLGDDNLNLFFGRNEDGLLGVHFTDLNGVTDVPTILGGMALTPVGGEDQIVLRLTHDADHRGVVRASFDVLDDGVITRSRSFDTVGHIFGADTPGYTGDDENWTRMQITAFGFDDRASSTMYQGTYGRATIDPTGRWTYNLDNTLPAVQALAQNQFAADSFALRVTDEYGLSSFRAQFVNVQGSNDPVTAAGGDTTGEVTEDALLVDTGTLAFSDIDLIDTHTALFAPGGVLGRLTLGPVVEASNTADISVGWSYSLNNADVQFLAEGETRSEMFLVTLNDTAGSGASQPVNITIHGTNDGPVARHDFFGVGAPGGASATLFDAEFNNTMASAQAITPAMFGLSANGEVLNATTVPWMRVSGFIGGTGNPAGANDVDMFSLQLAAGATLTLDVDHGMPSPDPIVHVFDSSGTLLTFNDDGFAGDAGSVHGFDSFLAYAVPAGGTYYIAVSSYSNFASSASSFSNSGGSTGDYVLNISLSNATVSAHAEDAVLNAGSVLDNDTDVDNGAVLRVAEYDMVSAMGAAVSMTSAGNFTYNPTAAHQIQALAAGETATDTFDYVVSDEHDATDEGTVSIALIGINDAPDIEDGGDTAGLVYEDGGRVATGQLSAVDIDNGVDLLSWEIASQGARGTAIVDAASGEWTYTLLNQLPAVQSLGHGAFFDDTFIVRAKDEHGAFDPLLSEQTVTVRILGTNDRPAIFNFAPPPGQPPLPAPSVTEDALLSVTRQFGTFDVDVGDLLGDGRTLSVSHGTPLGYRSNFLFSADRFTIVSNDVTVLDDTFSDGVVPNTGPTPLYLTAGQLTESGGKLVFDGSKAGSFRGAGFNGLVAGMDAVWISDANSANTTDGLKRANDFTVEAVYDLVMPVGVRSGYGLSLSDSIGGPLNALTTQTGDDSVDLNVRRQADGLVYVRLTTSSAATDSGFLRQEMLLQDVLDAVPVGATPDQIRLRLNHLADEFDVEASFELLDDGVVIEGTATVFGTTAKLFGANTPDFEADDEEYTRASISVSGLDANANTTSIAGTYGTLTVPATPLNAAQPNASWTYTLNTSAANVQALSQGQSVTDSFHVRVTDTRGVSAALPVTITVNGADEAAASTPSLLSQTILANVGNQGFNDVEYGLGRVYIAGQSNQGQGQSLAFAFSEGDLARAAWSRPWDGQFSFSTGEAFNGVTVNPANSDVVFAGTSYRSTIDSAGGMEAKAVLVAFDAAGANGPALGGADWVRQGDWAGSEALYQYTGVEGFQAVTASVEGGNTSYYAAGFGQPFSFGAMMVFKTDANGVAIAAAPDPALGTFADVPPAGFTGGGSGAMDVAVLGNRVYVAGTTGWEHLGDAGNRPALWSFNQDLGAPAIYKDTTLLGIFNGVTAVSDGLYAVGHTFGSEVDYLVEKFDAAGNFLWRSTINALGANSLWDAVMVGNRLFASGYSNGEGSGNHDLVLLEIDPSNGAMLSKTVFGGAGSDVGAGITTDGTHIYVVGSSFSFSTGMTQSDGVLLKYDLSGSGGAPQSNLLGGPGNDNITGTSFNDVISGLAGNDTLDGVGGADRFDYNPGDLGLGSDTIVGFTPGAGGDALDIRDLLVGYTPGASNAASFVQLSPAFSGPPPGGVPIGTLVLVNTDGIGTDLAPVALLQNVHGLLLDDMIANGNLVLA